MRRCRCSCPLQATDMGLLDLSPCLTDPPAHGPRARATHHDQFARGPHRPGRARLRHITGMDVCKMSCARRDIVTPERTLVELCQACARETLFLVTVSPHVLCIPIVAGDNSSHRALQTLATCALPADTVSVSSTMTPLELVILLCTTLSHHW